MVFGMQETQENKGGPNERKDHLIKRSLPSNLQSSPGNSPASVD